MRKLIPVLCILILGCLKPDEAYKRFVLVHTPYNSGSGVAIGHGYILTAKHVILHNDSIMKPVIVTPTAIDSQAQFVDSLDDIALIRSSLTKDLGWARFSEASVGEEVLWIQPFITVGRDTVDIQIYLNQAHISRITDHYIYIDHAGFPGMSGSAIFNKNMEIVGIGDKLIREFDQIVITMAVKYPEFEELLKGASP